MTETESSGRADSPPPPRRADDFDGAYAGTPPWDIGRPQPVLLALAEAQMIVSPVLDVGCGTGEHALMAASRGHEATGVDTSPTAISIAEGKAAERGLEVRFHVADALDLASLDEKFTTVLDSGPFHVFENEDRGRFVESLRAVIPPGGRYHMLCFSDSQPGEWGPRRVAEREIRSSFADGWEVESVVPTRMDLTLSQDGVAAWFSTVRRA